MAIDDSILKLKSQQPRWTNTLRQSCNVTRIQNIANERTEEKQEIASEEHHVSMARLLASQTQEQSVRSTDALCRMYTVHPKNYECFYLRLVFDVSSQVSHDGSFYIN